MVKHMLKTNMLTLVINMARPRKKIEQGSIIWLCGITKSLAWISKYM